MWFVAINTAAEPLPMALIARPIIIIGAGRSGTSLLDAMLGAHPAVAMFGEFDGTIEQLWRQFWRVSAAETLRSRRIEAIRQAEPEPDGASDAAEIFARVRDLERQERERVAQIIRDTLDRLYGVGESPSRYWGFKEIWAGDAGVPDWQACDTVFPEALYLHIIRHPFDFARSSADWQRRPFTAAQLRADLAAWLGHLRLNAARAETGRYFRLRYEALLADPEAALAGLFARLELGWDPACRSAFGRRYVPSGRDSPLPHGVAAEARDAVPGLGPSHGCARAMICRQRALPVDRHVADSRHGGTGRTSPGWTPTAGGSTRPSRPIAASPGRRGCTWRPNWPDSKPVPTRSNNPIARR